MRKQKEILQVVGLILQGLKQEFLQLFQTKVSFYLFTQLYFYWTLSLSHSTWAFPKGLILAEIQKSNYSEEKTYINLDLKISC